jgi:two-component system, NtrC family, response regulator AtoC
VTTPLTGRRPPVRRRLLVVDDEPTILDIVREHFSAEYDIGAAASATEAVRVLDQRRPDVILLDINMPGVDGLKLLMFLRKVDPGVPIIVVTANTSNKVAADCVKAGAFGYIPKPFNLTYMEHFVAAAIEQSPLRDI